MYDSEILRHKYTFFASAILSIAINLVGTATTPFLSEEISKPLTDIYPEMVRNNEVAINPMGVMTPVTERNFRWLNYKDYSLHSWNIGEKIGLKGFASLVPLLAIWLLYALYLYRELNRSEN